MSNASCAAVLMAALTLPTVGAATAHAQEPPMPDHQHMAMDSTAPGWTWMTDGSIFFGYNYQERKFRDFSAWESQNWVMLAGEHPLERGTFSFDAMISLEPFTLDKIGSPQVFQTGETYHGGPIIDRQHPHDLIMGLGAKYRLPRGQVTYLFGADVVGAPALGPTPFMHRASARDNPQAPLIHHYIDSTHITPGVLTAGVESHGVTVEGSWFRGEEPNDNRLNIDKPMFDSWSGRVSWAQRPVARAVLRRRSSTARGVRAVRLSRAHRVDRIRRPARVASVRGHAPVGREPRGPRHPRRLSLRVGLRASPAHDTSMDARSRRPRICSTSAAPILPASSSSIASRTSQALTVGYVHEISQQPLGPRRHRRRRDHVPRARQPARVLRRSPHSFHVFVRYRPLASMHMH